MITLKTLTDDDSDTIGFVIIVDDAVDMVGFKELVQRGANLWPDAPASIKSFADIVTNGQVMQDYNNLPLSKGKLK
jgi:hypothetical protein